MSYPAAVPVEIRWDDVDAFGHVSHIALVAMHEHGRGRWIDYGLGLAPPTWLYIVVHLAVDYRAPVGFNDRSVNATFTTTRVGKSSVHLDERLLAPDGRVVTDAKSVIVAWDPDRSTARPLTAEESARFAAAQHETPG